MTWMIRMIRMTRRPARTVIPILAGLALAPSAVADVRSDVDAVLSDWGKHDARTDRNADGVVDTRDLVLALTGETRRSGESFFKTQEAYGGTLFIGVDCFSFVDAGWEENGYSNLVTHRLYATFEPGGANRGVIAVYGITDQTLSVTSQSGAMHNDPLGGHTAPQDLRSAGIWSNQWDTYVTINATEATGDGVQLPPDFEEETNGLAESFTSDNTGWLVFPDDPQAEAIGERVLLAQFTVEEGIDVFGTINLLLLDGHTPIGVEFYCAGEGEAALGACCIESGANCRTTTESACTEVFGGVFEGAGTNCMRQIVDTPCHPGASGQHCVRIEATCPEPGAARGGCVPGLLLDAWVSPEEEGGGSGQTTYHDFGADGQSIPADFFAYGSDPIVDLVTFKSVPIGGDFGAADTLIKRSADPFDRCSLPSGDEVAIDAEVFFLSLESADPIRVTYLNGQYEQLWHVSLALSVIRPPAGTLRATKTTCNGGTYTVENLRVQPQFKFTRIDNPEDIRVFDTGVRGIDPVVLSLENGHWVSDVDPGLVVFSPYCTEFRPGVIDAAPPANCDCNGNELRDACDIEAGESLDCNANAVPDECEIAEGAADCNKNGVLDRCECPGDVISDCNVGFDDILAVIEAWGPCQGCIADVTGDNEVGYGDILEILRTWGPCGGN